METNIDGKKVKIDIGKILNRKRSFSKKYIKFLNYAKDKTFTAREEIFGKITGILYTLEEDPSEVKWLFYNDDLIVVEE
jgi:hypothetical protein